MGNLCTKPEVEPVEEEEEKKEWTPVKRPTKGEGLLGKTEWTDDEEEDDEEGEGIDGEPREIIGELPQINTKTQSDDTPATRSSRVTLINRPQCLSVVNNEIVESNVTITFIGQVPNNSVEASKRINEEIQNLADPDKTIRLYSGNLTENLKHIKLDATVTKQSNSGDSSGDYVNLTRGGCQLMCGRLDERIGILGLTEADDDGKWLEYLKSEAKKMRDSDQPHMIIALTTCDIVKARQLGSICVEGVKAILCQDESVPSSEEVVLGTPIINLNPTENKICRIDVAFDNFHQVDCKPAKFLNY